MAACCRARRHSGRRGVLAESRLQRVVVRQNELGRPCGGSGYAEGSPRRDRPRKKNRSSGTRRHARAEGRRRAVFRDVLNARQAYPAFPAGHDSVEENGIENDRACRLAARLSLFVAPEINRYFPGRSTDSKAQVYVASTARSVCPGQLPQPDNVLAKLAARGSTSREGTSASLRGLPCAGEELSIHRDPVDTLQGLLDFRESTISAFSIRGRLCGKRPLVETHRPGAWHENTPDVEGPLARFLRSRREGRRTSARRADVTPVSAIQ